MIEWLWRTFFGKTKAMPVSYPGPPLLPSATERYVPYGQVGDHHTYDILDGENGVGRLYRQDGDEEHDDSWVVRVNEVETDFPTLRAVKIWLGNPPVRRFR